MPPEPIFSRSRTMGGTCRSLATALAAFLLAIAAMCGPLPAGLRTMSWQGLAGDRAGQSVDDGASSSVWARSASCGKATRTPVPALGGLGGGNDRVAALPPLSGHDGEFAASASLDPAAPCQHRISNGLFTRRVPTGPPLPRSGAFRGDSFHG